MNVGWIKLHRKTLDSPIFDNPKLFKVWAWCLLKASHKAITIPIGRQIVDIKEGEFVYGRKQAAIELKLCESTVRDYMKLLEKLEMITINTTNKYSIISIVNWGIYQDIETKDRQQIDTETDIKSADKSSTNNNKKNNKNEKKHKYGEFSHVLLTDNQYNKLLDDLGTDTTLFWIKQLDEYKQQTGKVYKDDYLTIRKWITKNGNKENSNESKQRKDYKDSIF